MSTSNTLRRHLAPGALAILAVLCWSPGADAQYFGQNKVQYDHFDFKVLKTEHFDIYYYPAEAQAAEQAGRMAERWYTRLSRVLNHNLNGRQPVILYASHPDFEQTNVVEGELGQGTGGVTESARRRVTLPFGGSLQETDHVLGHELVHAFQYDMLGTGAEGLPLWFIEGMAEYLSLGSRDVQTAMWLRDAALENKLPTIDDLDNPRYFPYRFGHAFWAYIGGRWGDETIGRILHSLSRLGTGAQSSPTDGIVAIEAATHTDRKTLSNAWHAAIRETYLLASSPEAGTVVGERSKEGSISVSPAISPDGSRVAFLSSRELLSIDLYLADTDGGRVVRKLVSTAADPHFQSLQFLQSAGTWNPTGRQLAVAAVRSGHPVLALIDTTNGHIDREIPFDSLGEIFQPAWSPDGKSIAFSAEVGGYTDLFVCDLASGQARRLTNDAPADLEPVWSPDGRQLVFVTERFSGTPAALDLAGYRLAVTDVETGSVKPVQTADYSGDMVNPQWTQDGKYVFFIGNAEGRQNVYRLDWSTHQVVRMTDEVTGVAGITPLSPALSVARSGRTAALSIFHDSGYEIRIRDLSGAPVPVGEAVRDQAVLPPVTRNQTAITQLLHQPSVGLPASSASFTTHPYSSKLSLINVGQSIGAATSQFGTYASGGIQFLFSDVLGNHLLGTGVAVNGGVKDVAVTANYLNRAHRWNWGLYGQRLPLLSGTVSTGLSQQGGQSVFVQQTELLRQTFTETGVVAEYPLSRATRLEFSASGSHIGFDDELRTQVVDLNGSLLADQTEQLQAPGSLKLAQVGAALVRDTAVFGGTSPILGQRFRFEAQPSFGDLQMVNVTADFRRYAMPFRPVTLAGRVLHFGRYGGSAEDQRLLPLFLGYSTLVRGYDVNSFTPSDCTPNATSSCPEFDQLVGSRILVLNGEVRAPLAGLFTGKLDYGPLPVEVFGFADSGVAWTADDKPAFAGGSRHWVTSVGAGARVNVFGYLVAEFNLARPLDRTQHGWTFVFNLQPGF